MAKTRLLDKALEHVSKGWFPAQESVLERVRQRFESGEYQENRQALTEDLKADFSLYMFCVKKLSEMIESGEINNHRTLAQIQEKSPHQILESCDHEVLKEIFASHEAEISIHKMKDVTELQALRLQESLLSASAAEVLAESTKINAELGYSCGLMRQLGLTLIAWNYPKIYSQAFSMITESETLDSVLHRLLGFSPAMLGIRFARNWGLSGEVRLALGDQSYRIASQKNPLEESQAQNVSEETAIGQALAKICEVGEALARANSPEHYPSAMADWQVAEEAIKEHLGPDGVDKVFERTKENCREYAKSYPKLSHYVERTPLTEVIHASHSIKMLLEKNSYLQSCSAAIQEKVSELYGRLDPDKTSQEDLRYLLYDIVPDAGFMNGCVFTFDPARNLLTPVIEIGEVTRERIRTVRLSSTLGHGDLVAAALCCRSPLREQISSLDGSIVSAFAGVMGSEENPVGVLYLESVEHDHIIENQKLMTIFQALRQCLRDCLHLSD